MSDEVTNSVDGHVSGPVVQARDVHGDVHLYDGARFIVPTEVEKPQAFGAGAEVTVGQRTYLVQAHLAEERWSDDGTTWRRQARCKAPDGHVWLRQATPAGALGAEADLLKALRGTGFPRVVQFDVTGRTTTLVSTWPTSSSGKPCDGLDALVGTHVMDSLRLFRFCGGLAGLGTTLGSLHERGLAHRGLTPDGVIVLDDGRLVLRDLGLAARPVGRNEHPSAYQAPEQHMRGSGNVGGWTDVYQVAALAYHVIAGRPAGPLPLTSWAPVPERLAAAVQAALAVDPAQRPDMRSFRAMVLAARTDIH